MGWGKQRKKHERKMNYAKEIYEKCVDCDLCFKECLFLNNVGKKPRQIAKCLLNNYVEERNLIYSCTLCGLCSKVCPLDLKPHEMFLEYRRHLVDSGIAPFRDHMFYMMDKKWNMYTLYRENYHIDYSDLVKDACNVIFFPGCAMSSFAPKLTRKVFEILSSNISSIGLSLDCCYRLLRDLGFQGRFEDAIHKLNRRLDRMGVTQIITTCPMCYRTLKDNLNKDIITLYSLLENVNLRDKATKLTIHDSCPDRLDHLIGTQIRKILRECQIKEMKHSKEKSLCCGAGGLVASVDPELCGNMAGKRLGEAEDADVDTMVVYCFNCLNILRSKTSKLRIKHILNMIFGLEEDFTQMTLNIKKMFVGKQGELNFRRIKTQI